VIDDESRWFTFDDLRSTLLSFDTATKETAVLISGQDEVPETIFTSVMLLDHLVREATCLLVSNEDLLWLEGCQFEDTFIDVTRNKVFIASMHFSISFLNESNPHFVRTFTGTKDWPLDEIS
jgi:hypothetical protein